MLTAGISVGNPPPSPSTAAVAAAAAAAADDEAPPAARRWHREAACGQGVGGSQEAAGRGVWCVGGDIWPEQQGSDHCPVWADFSCVGGGAFPCATTGKRASLALQCWVLPFLVLACCFAMLREAVTLSSALHQSLPSARLPLLLLPACLPAAPPGAMRFAFKGSQLKLHSWLQRGESAAQLLNSDPAASSSNGSQLLHGLSTAEQQQQQQTAATRPPGNHASGSSQRQAAASGLGSPRVAAASGGGSGSASGAGAAVGKKQANLKSLFKRQQQGTQPVQLEQQQQQQPVPPPWGSQQPPSQQSQQQQGEAGPNATSDFFAAELAASTASRQQSSEAAKDAWRTIQQRFQVPQCPGHREPAVLKKVNKSGPNKGKCAADSMAGCTNSCRCQDRTVSFSAATVLLCLSRACLALQAATSTPAPAPTAPSRTASASFSSERLGGGLAGRVLHGCS